jgi:hypothetical protein
MSLHDQAHVSLSSCSPSYNHYKGHAFVQYEADHSSSSDADCHFGMPIDEEDDKHDQHVSDCIREIVSSATIPTCNEPKECYDVISDDHQLLVSIIKFRTKFEPRFIQSHRRSWKSLPPPDLDRILTGVVSGNGIDRQKSKSGDAAQQHRVSFGVVRIRSYTQTLGDNPSVSYGPPIQLDWEYEEHSSVPLDTYESNRGRRRSLKQLVLNYYHRKNILFWQYGVSEEDLKKAKKEANKIKLKRVITRSLLPIMPVESAFENASRTAKQIIHSRHHVVSGSK